MLSFPLLLVLVFLIGTLWTPFYADQATIIPAMLGEDERVVARGNAILLGSYRSTYWLGPLSAGLFIAAFAAPVVLFIDAATFLVGAALLAVPAARAPVETEHANDVLAGVRFIARTPLLRSITAAQVLTQASFQPRSFSRCPYSRSSATGRTRRWRASWMAPGEGPRLGRPPRRYAGNGEHTGHALLLPDYC